MWVTLTDVGCHILSQYIGDLLIFNLKSFRVYCIYITCEQAKAAKIYSASVVDKDTVFCFLLNQETSECLKKWHVPLVLLRSDLHPA